MTLGDIYKHKKIPDTFISINCLASPVNKERNKNGEHFVVVFGKLRFDGDMWLIAGHDFGYGSVSEIEEEYELYLDGDYIRAQDYKALNNITELDNE